MLRPVRLTRGVPTTGALEATPTICLHQGVTRDHNNRDGDLVHILGILDLGFHRIEDLSNDVLKRHDYKLGDT